MMTDKGKVFGDDEAWLLILATTDPRKHERIGRSVRAFDRAIFSPADTR